MPATDAAEILRTTIEEGQSELERSSVGLAFSGFIAGLNIPFGAVATAVMAVLAGGKGVVPILFSPLGFLIVMLGQAELFTAHTVSGVAATLREIDYWRNLIRLWVVVLVFNLLGTALFAALLIYGKVLPPSALGLYPLPDLTKLLEANLVAVVRRSLVAGPTKGPERLAACLGFVP